jgi:prolipoprotein diacylglyceryltransferase
MGMEYIPGSVDEYAYQLIQPVYPTPLYEALMALGLFELICFGQEINRGKRVGYLRFT